MRTFILITGLVVGLWQPVDAYAQLKIGFVNAGKILDQSPLAEQARTRLEEEFAARDKAIVESQQALRTLEDKLVNDSARLEEAERRALEREIRSLEREVERDKEEFREDFNIRRNEELRKLQRLVYEAIVGLAKEEGFDLIVNDGAVIFASQQADVTDKVLKRLQ